MDKMKLLGITRETDKITDLIETAQSKGIEIVPLPLTITTYLPLNLRDLDTFDWVIFTSQNGVESFYKSLDDNNRKSIKNLKIAVVGEKTEKALECLEVKADFKPSKSYGRILFTEFVEKYKNENIKVLYVRAEKVNYEPDSIFKRNSIEFNSIISYKTKSNKINADLIEKFNNDDYIFFTSSSNVESFNEQFGKPKAKIIAIGETTAKKMLAKDWNNIITMKNQDIDKIWEYI